MNKLTLITLTILLATQAHASCFIMGDSIAYGISTQAPACQANAKVGLNTRDALTRFSVIPATDTTVISLGVNDRGSSLPTARNLEAIRNRVKSANVVWILPTSYEIAKHQTVAKVAAAHGDKTLNVDSLIGADHIHPTNYTTIARELKL
ncbi:hypothetical protein LFL96_25835 [Paraburkholderia sp. D15]|uniref:hypothetical protein n=1 Tax=Paraburkholderia sp. D15 TaxID=2880218 RepID=UPI00247A3E4F|nr:hypothetical protein [Paraburkholderia sp. D15]WGS54437.1 hypothetical protein LFL96_25835 [Paraburkholderia sp. D15]